MDVFLFWMKLRPVSALRMAALRSITVSNRTSATYAKALGNGYPIAAFGGKKEIMSIIGHGVAQGGTYTNNKPGVAGAYATLSLLKSKPILKTIEKRGQRLMDGLKDIFEENDIPVVFTGYPAMFSFSLGVDTVTCQRDWANSDQEMYLKSGGEGN